MKCRKNFLLSSEIIILLKNIGFKVGERYCFEFDVVVTDGDHVHFLLVLSQNILFQSYQTAKSIYSMSNLQTTL
jgi:REP element-mobilizing transposase RayT